MRDDNSQQREEHEHQEWWEKNREILKAFEELSPIIQGKKDDTGRNIQSTKTPF